MFRFAVVLGCTVVLSACSVMPKFKEGIVLNNQIQFAGIDSIAKTSPDVLNFASKIYMRPSDKKDADCVVVEKTGADKSFVAEKRYAAADRQIFGSYCKAKNGELFQWDVDSRTIEYGQFRGVNKRIITCEVASKIESALLYESYLKDSIFPYEIYTTYANSRYVENMFNEAKVKGFTSSNGMITIPATKIFDPASRYNSYSDIFTAQFKYKNTTSKPVEIDFKNSFVSLNGARYELGRYSNEIIYWNRYDGRDPSVFVGEKGNYKSKLRFNPGQNLEGEISFVIPGLTKVTEDDMKNMVLQFDGVTCDGFKVANYYDINKKADQKTDDKNRSASR